MVKIIDTWHQVLLQQSDNQKVMKKKSKDKLSMITLTLSGAQKHTDREIKRLLLNTFLIYAKRKWGTDKYLWKAEKQQNGNIHFHIIMDKYIDHKELRDLWNEIQDKWNYLDDYASKFGHKDANSTDIHLVKEGHRTASYMVKYMTKEGGQQFDAGRVWGCSDNLRELKSAVMEFSNGMSKMINELDNNELYKKVQVEHAYLIYGDIVSYMKKNHSKLWREYSEWIEGMAFLMNKTEREMKGADEMFELQMKNGIELNGWKGMIL